MWWQWLILGLIMVLAPASVISLYVWASKKQENLTEDKKKKASVRVVCLILYYWLLGFFYMVSFNHWLVWQFILGGLVLLLFFTGLANAVSSPAPKGSIITFSNLLDLAIGIGVSAYLLYIIPSKRLQNVLIPIVAAVYGGLLTLVGVAWTIRYNQMVKKTEEKEKAKPYLHLVSAQSLMVGRSEKFDGVVKISFFEKGRKILDLQKFLHIKNVGGMFIFEAIKLNTVYKRCKKTLLAENNTLLLVLNSLWLDADDMVNLIIYGRDKLDNYYYFTVENKIEKRNDALSWEIVCISMPVEIGKEEMQAIYNKCEIAEGSESKTV